MKTSRQHSGRAFTLVELLVVIAIIAILAALLLPVLARGPRAAKVAQAKVEVGNITAAILTYRADYGRLPTSTNAMNAAAAAATGPEDFTYGTQNLPAIEAPNGGTVPVMAVDANGTRLSYQANNSEVMAILLDMEYFSNNPAMPTANQGHVRNPQRTRYLNARVVSDISQPGLGPDLVYRDPWGQPYIITLDLNGDGNARDGFYRSRKVSADPASSSNPQAGLNGLVPIIVGGNKGNPVYEALEPIMVWSAGPDKMIDNATATATTGANKDNVLSWKP